MLAALVAPASIAVQPTPRGTADAVLCARAALEGFPAGGTEGDIAILFGDAALIEAETLRDLVLARRKADAALAVLGVRLAEPSRYGRLVKDAAGNIIDGPASGCTPAYVSPDGEGIANEVEKTLKKAGITADDIALVVPHQANTRIIDAACQRLGVPMERAAIVIDWTGNNSSASIPIALVDVSKPAVSGTALESPVASVARIVLVQPRVPRAPPLA